MEVYFKVFSRHRLEGLRYTTKTRINNNLYLERHSNRMLPEYKSDASPSEKVYSVLLCVIIILDPT
jgi:hypothetical protein